MSGDKSKRNFMKPAPDNIIRLLIRSDDIGTRVNNSALKTVDQNAGVFLVTLRLHPSVLSCSDLFVPSEN